MKHIKKMNKPFIIYEQEKPKRSGTWKIMKVNRDFYFKIEKLVEKGIFRTRIEATEKLALLPALDSNMWKRKTIRPKSKPIKIISNKGKRRKVELEFM